MEHQPCKTLSLAAVLHGRAHTHILVHKSCTSDEAFLTSQSVRLTYSWHDLNTGHTDFMTLLLKHNSSILPPAMFF